MRLLVLNMLIVMLIKTFISKNHKEDFSPLFSFSASWLRYASMGTEADLDTDSAPAMPGSTQQVNNEDLLDSNVRSKCSICSSTVGHKAFTCC